MHTRIVRIVLLALSVGALTAVPGTAHANHTACDNEPVANPLHDSHTADLVDVWVGNPQQSLEDIMYVRIRGVGLVGVDLENLVSPFACLDDETNTVPITALGVEITDPDPVTPGVRIAIKLGTNGPDTYLLAPTGVELKGAESCVWINSNQTNPFCYLI